MQTSNTACTYLYSVMQCLYIAACISALCLEHVWLFCWLVLSLALTRACATLSLVLFGYHCSMWSWFVLVFLHMLQVALQTCYRNVTASRQAARMIGPPGYSSGRPHVVLQFRSQCSEAAPIIITIIVLVSQRMCQQQQPQQPYHSCRQVAAATL